MKIRNIILLVSLIMICLITASCSKSDDPTNKYCCFPRSFKETYLKHFQNNEIFLIKGEALLVNKHGREIKVIEDLKGNFGGKSSIFVWGISDIVLPGTGSTVSTSDGRVDNITQYNNGDTLIIFIKKAHKRFSGIERSGDYATLGECNPSVIKLSNGYVSGRVNGLNVPVPWKEMQEELHILLNFLNSDEKPLWWSEDFVIPDPFIITYNAINDNHSFFIQGVVLYSYKGYSNHIQTITDFKGNFPDKTEPFWWREADSYNVGDTLFMLLRLTPDYYMKEISTLNPFSVLKLSNDSVRGYITSVYKGEEIMPLDEFQTLLNLNKETQQ